MPPLPTFADVENAARQLVGAANETPVVNSRTVNRRTGAEMVVRKVIETGPLRPGLTLERAVDSLWIFNDPAHYATLVLERNWPEPEYQRWLTAQMCAALLPGYCD